MARTWTGVVAGSGTAMVSSEQGKLDRNGYQSVRNRVGRI